MTTPKRQKPESSMPQRTPAEQRFLDTLARLVGRPLTVQEANLAIDQAKAIGRTTSPNVPLAGHDDANNLYRTAPRGVLVSV
jgi:hypothetical protein